MSCHGIFLIYSFFTWKVLCDLAKYIFYDLSWNNILSCHMHGLFWDQQWLIDCEHGFG